MASTTTSQFPSGEATPVSGERVRGIPKAGKFTKMPAAMTPAEKGANKAASNRRAAWEATPEGKARTTSDVTPQEHFHNNYDRPEAPGPKAYDVQLPGMADPDAAPRPPRWEELGHEAQQHTVRALAAHGTNMDQMTKDLGAQYDQAKSRQWKNGDEHAYGEDFYTSGAPRQKIESSAKELGISPLIHAQMNAFTSPNTKFSQRSGETGEMVYPNDTAAKHAVRHIQQGGTPENLSNELSTTGTGTQRAQGYTNNMVKAASAYKQHTEGVAPADWKTSKDGTKGPFDSSPKTGPYANSWSDSHPQFFVSDVHSGGGGAFPHLSAEKVAKTDAAGNVITKKNSEGKDIIQRNKSERESALEKIPFAHSAIDYAARQAMKSRSVGQTRMFQGAQWGEEQTQRGIDSRDDGLPPRKETHKQGSLF